MIRIVFLVVLVCLSIFTTGSDYRDFPFRGLKKSRNYRDDASDWSNLDRFSDFFGDSRRTRKLTKKKYTRLIMNREKFYYWNINYENWSNWTKCMPENCTKSRYRKCKDFSWEENVRDFKRQKKCPVQYIYEKMACNDSVECVQKILKIDNSTNVLPDDCGIRPIQIENKVYGGQESFKNSWPWHVGLFLNTRYKSIYICGGTLINPGWVVTAAHCLKTVEKMNAVPLGEIIDTRKYDFFDSFQLVIGTHDISAIDRKEEVRKISHFIIHPSFRADYSSNLYDVALLKLDKTVKQKEHIKFACVPKHKNYTIAKSSNCIAIGWGNVRSQDPDDIWSFEFDWFLERWKKNKRPRSRHSRTLQEVEIPLVDFNICKKIYRIFNLNKDIHICAGSRNKDTCRGDSGGGLFCLDPQTNRWQLYGVTNFGSARGCGKSYGVYIRVAELAGWIREIIKKQIV